MCDVTSVTPPWRRLSPDSTMAMLCARACSTRRRSRCWAATILRSAHKSHRTCNATGPRGCCDSELSRVNIHMHICRPQRHYNAHEWRYPPPGEQHWAWCEVTPPHSAHAPLCCPAAMYSSSDAASTAVDQPWCQSPDDCNARDTRSAAWAALSLQRDTGTPESLSRPWVTPPRKLPREWK